MCSLQLSSLPAVGLGVPLNQPPAFHLQKVKSSSVYSGQVTDLVIAELSFLSKQVTLSEEH